MQEIAADAVVETHAARHLLHVGADLLAQIGDLVDEGDLGGKEGVGRVFDQLGGAPADIDDRRRVEIKRPVDFRDHGARPRIVGADHDAVGMLEILDRGAFAQEFRIGDDLDIGVGPRSRRMRSISSPVPTGTVDLVMTTALAESSGAISRTAS